MNRKINSASAVSSLDSATLKRIPEAILFLMALLGVLFFGIYTLNQNSTQLLRPSRWLPTPVVERGQVITADGFPAAYSIYDDMHTNPELRIHPLGNSMTQLLGMNQRDTGEGKSGLEYDLQSRLKAGGDVHLTIHSVVQSIAENALWQGIKNSGADWGTALVMETKTGNLLAVANGPRFDLDAKRGDVNTDIRWRNHAFKVSLDPGSTMKALTAAVLVDKGVANLNTVVHSPMSRRIAGHTINDVVAHPNDLSLAQVLKYSSNVGISRLAERLPKRSLYNYMTKFGFQNSDQLEKIGESPSRIAKASAWTQLDAATASFGQGFIVSPLQLTSAFNTLANDGKFVSPSLIVGKQGPSEQVFKPATAKAIRSALTTAAASMARLPGYEIGGKTGTAQVVTDGKYSSTVFNALFAGFFPSKNPKVTVVVILHHPIGENIHGSQVAAPIFKDIAAGLFSYWGVAPDLDLAERQRKQR